MSAAAGDDWVCRCRKCHGVSTSADALQYGYEFVVGEYQRDLVVLFCAFGVDGRCSYTAPYLDGEPDVLEVIGERGWVFSCRPGRSAIPTEADIARWEGWRGNEPDLLDWFLIDGDRWTSVAGVASALRERRPVPRSETFSNYWWRE